MQLEEPTKVLAKIFHKSNLKTIYPGVLTVSAYANFYPVCYLNKRGKIQGLDVEIMKEFAKLCKLKIVFKIKPQFKDIWFDPVRGESDVAIGGIGIRESRSRKDTEWTIPYFYVKRTCIFNKLDPIYSFPKNANKTILSTKGSTGWVDGQERLLKSGKISLLKQGTTDEDDINKLLNGNVQGLLRGSFVGEAIVKKYPNQLGMTKPWAMDPNLVVKDGEVFAYPCNVHSRIGVLLSVLLTEEIMSKNLLHLIKKYNLQSD